MADPVPLFETLLWRCFAGRAQLADQGISAFVRADPTESTLVFRLDKPAFRAGTGTGTGTICDGLILGLAPPCGPAEQQTYYLFVELKGRDIEHAVTQLATALQLFRDHRSRIDAQSRTRFSAVILSDRASPESLPLTVTRSFAKEFKARLHLVPAQRHGPPADLTDYLWRRPVPNLHSTTA